jgi:hypothetical protein
VSGVCVRPTKLGIALRLSEWNRLKEVAKVLNEKFSAVADAQFDVPALTLAFNQTGAITCGECNPNRT